MADWSVEKLPLGRTDLSVSQICIGTSPLGSAPQLYGYEVNEARALDTLRAVWSSPFNFVDTSNGYGNGRSEEIISRAIAERGGLPEGFRAGDEGRSGAAIARFFRGSVRRSAEESLKRLGLERSQVLHLHDPDLHMDYAASMRPDGPVYALRRLKEEGVAQFIEVATGSPQLLSEYLSTGLFDVILNHNHFTLLERDADALMDACLTRRVGFLNAAPYGGGILARGAMSGAKYAYVPASDRQIGMVREIQNACDRYSVPIAAAALQFSVRDKRIASTIVGVSSPERIAQTQALARHPTPADLWEEIEQIRAARR